MGAQKRCDTQRGGTLCLPAQEIGLQAALDQECGMRIERGAENPGTGAHPLDELAACEHRPAHDVAVARCVLRQAVNEEIHGVAAVVVQPCQRVVEQGQRAVLPREGR